MNKADLLKLRTKIVAKLTSLETTASFAREAMRSSIESVPNFLQDASDAVKGEIDLINAARVHQHTSAQHALLVGALMRMDAGVYGTCIECGDDIGLRRLEAMPGAHLCVHCQSIHEFGSAPEFERSARATKVLMRSAA